MPAQLLFSLSLLLLSQCVRVLLPLRGCENENESEHAVYSVQPAEQSAQAAHARLCLRLAQSLINSCSSIRVANACVCFCFSALPCNVWAHIET